MNTINYVIVEVDNDYINTTNFGGINIVTNTSIETVKNINRIGKVISTPDFIILKEGDEVIMHHNICRLRNGLKGELVQSDYWIEGNKYFVPLTQIFMYKRNQDWEAFSPFCFIKPIKDKKNKINSILLPYSNREDNYQGMIKNHGIVAYSNKELIEMGINVGDEIVFSDYSEYEFDINGETYYKMSTNDILGKIE